MIGFYLLEGFSLFAGVTLWFLITQKGSAVVTTNFANVVKTLVQDTPPMPNLDLVMWLRLGLLILVAWAMHEDFELTVDILEELWNDVVVYVWSLVADFGHLLVFFADLAIPLYNWYVTLVSQLTTGSYTILAKCQIKTIIESLVHVGEAMGFLAGSFKDFVLNPKGAFDIYNTTKALQTAVVTQESVIQCACDGITPAFGIAFDVVRPAMLANIVNETFNALVAVPQTAVLAIPPWSQIPDGSKIIHPLKRAAEMTGLYMDTVAQNVLKRILGSKPKRIPVFSVAGYAAQAALGLLEMLLHAATRIILVQPITFDPQRVHQSLLNMADSLEESTLQILSAVIEPLNLGATAVADQAGGNLDAANTLQATASDLQESVKPLSRAVGYLTKAAVGLPMSVIDELFFVFRNDNAGLTFMQTLQRWDGHWAKTNQTGITLQEHFFQNIDSATYEAEEFFLVWSFIPVAVRSVSRIVNVALRVILSSEDIVQDKFFHKPINCGYGVNELCSDECTFYYDPDNAYLPINKNRPEDPTYTNPCNTLITEWIFSSLEDFSNVLSDIFKKIRPQHSETWCDAYQFPNNARCAKSNTDFMCATSTSLKEAVDVPVNAIRHAYSVTTVIFAKEETIQMELEDRLCDLSTVLYALAGNAVAIVPNEIISADFKQEITDLMHSIVVLPVYLLRAYAVLAQYGASAILGSDVPWDQIIEDAEKELISEKYRRIQTTTTTTQTSVALAENTANFVVAEIVLAFNYGINVLDSASVLVGGDKNFFTGAAKMLSVLKNSLSKEMINLVTLVFKVGSNLLAMVTQGRTNVGELAEDIVTIVTKSINIIASVASQIVVSVLKLLGPVGDFLTFLWKGVCDAGDVIEWLTGADFSGVCAAVDDYAGRRRTLAAAQQTVIRTKGWDGDSECDLLAHHYNGKLWQEATYLEQIRLIDCSEQRATMQKLNHILNITLPHDLIYNWKTKYHVAYQAVLGFVVYSKHQNKQRMLDEWDRLELPRYFLDIWSRVKIEIPWTTVIDDAITQTVAPVPELTSVYDETKHMLVQFHHTWNEHNMHEMHTMQLPKLHGMLLGSKEYKTITTHHTLAWGLKTNIDVEGPLNCTVADNFVHAMTNATERLNDYYTGPFVEYVLPNFIGWIKDTPLPLEPPNASMPNLRLPSKLELKEGILYSFQTCQAEDVRCDPNRALERVERITESLWYILYAGVGMGALALLTGVSLFPLMQLAPLLVLAHTWNYRLTCTPNVPDCFFDDTLRWIQSYRPREWKQYFPELALNKTCSDSNYLWSTAYYAAKTPLKGPIEYVLYQNEDAYQMWGAWTETSPLKDECALLRLPDTVFTPAIIYATYTLWGLFAWTATAAVRIASTILPILSTVNAIEQHKD